MRAPPLPGRPALFLDVDGTLLDLRARPEDVRADAALRAQLERLACRLDGAVAIVSGRSLEDLDRVFGALRPAAAGLHGLERRSAGGRLARASYDVAALRQAAERLASFVRTRPGLRLEDKGGAVAVHFRGAPEREAEVEREFAARVQELGADFHVQHGLLVRELKSRHANKGTAVREFMAEPPFCGRVPIAIGDDVTDVDAFRAAEQLGGFGVAVGQRVAARCWLPGPRALRAWLAALAEGGRDAHIECPGADRATTRMTEP